MFKLMYINKIILFKKVSDYEAIHPIKNWVDLKRRVGPYRRCYIFTHPSMPREPLVVLHTALCDTIPETVKGIEEAEKRIVEKTTALSVQENVNQIKAAVFYSISTTQKGLQVNIYVTLIIIININLIKYVGYRAW